MNTGVEILLRRMETHPEEFTPPIQHGTSKWADLIHAYKDHIDAEDYEALKLGMKKVLQDKFTERVMQTLAGVDETSDEGKSLRHPIQGTGLGGATQGAYTLNSDGGQVSWENREPLGHALDAQKYQNEMIRQHLDAHREAMNKVEVNKKPLIKRIFE